MGLLCVHRREHDGCYPIQRVKRLPGTEGPLHSSGCLTVQSVYFLSRYSGRSSYLTVNRLLRRQVRDGVLGAVCAQAVATGPAVRAVDAAGGGPDSRPGACHYGSM